jgi:hypothetical protein
LASSNAYNVGQDLFPASIQQDLGSSQFSMAWDSMGLSIIGNSNPHIRASSDQLDRASVSSKAASAPDLSNHIGNPDSVPDFQDNQDRFLTAAMLAEELKRLQRTFNASIERSHNSIMGQLPHFIDAAESRVTDSVLAKVASEYNRIGINCIESRAKCRSDISNVNILLKDHSDSLIAVAQQVATISVSDDELRSVKSQLAEIVSQLQTLEANLNLRDDQTDLSALNESIRALSLRIGTLETGLRTNRDSSGCQPPVVPGISQTVPLAPVEGAFASQMHSAGNAGSPSRQRPAPPSASSSPPRSAGALDQNISSTSYSADPTARHQRILRKARICADLILSIVSKDLSKVASKAEVLELVNYDLKKLEDHKKIFAKLEKDWESLGVCDEDTATLFDDTNFSVVGWEHSLIDLKRKFFMHLQPSHSLLKNVELAPFTGSPDSDTIYQFLNIFHRLTDSGCNPEEQADLLYTNYLCPEIQSEVFSFKSDLHRMEQWLIQQHGDLRTIADNRMRRISQLKHPQDYQPYKVHADYYKSVMQLILHLESLASNDRVNQYEIASIIYNSSWVTQLVSRLPEEILLSFTKLLEKEPKIPPPSGKRYFEILRNLIDSTWRQLNTANRIRLCNDAGHPSDSGKAVCPSGLVTSQPDPHDSGAKAAPKKKKASATVSQSAVSFPCPLHGTLARHGLGFCETFFRGTNAQRFELCKQVKACFSCFKPECMKVSPKACITSNLPSSLLCPECQQSSSKRTLSVLLCSNSNHTKPSLKAVQNALTTYLKSLNVKLIDHLKQQFNLFRSHCQAASNPAANHSLPRSKSSPVQPSLSVPVFDTVSGSLVNAPKIVKKESEEDTCYVFQFIQIGSEKALVFYDSGATSNLVLGSFAERAGFKTIDPDSQLIGALGNTSFWTEYGLYAAVLGCEQTGMYYHLTFQGISEITSKFPHYDWSTVIPEVHASGMLNSKEKLPTHVGGRPTDILIGLRTPELLPRLLFTLPSGLGVYRCQLKDVNGSSIAFGGPHSIISKMNRRFHNFSKTHMSCFLTGLVSSYHGSPWLGTQLDLPSKRNPLTFRPSEFQSVLFESTPISGEHLAICSTSIDQGPLLLDPNTNCALLSPSGQSPMDCSVHTVDQDQSGSELPDRCLKAKIPLAKLKQIMENDNEPLVSYRCSSCEDCVDCRSSPVLKSTSLRDRTEQKLIESSVRISYEEARVYVSLPFLQDPVPFFGKHFGSKGSNLDQARLIFQQQCRKKEPEKEGIRSEMSKLLEAGFVCPLSDLPPETQSLINSAPVKHYFPWRSVFKPDSKSTPTRLVVDPSMSLLNLILAKGDPQLSSMFSILLRSRAAPCLWSADIKKLYNMLVLEEHCLPYSLFLYNETLDLCDEPQVFVLQRAWYGVASTSGQATYALRKLGLDHLHSHPLGARVLLSDSYVDDILSPTQTRDESEKQVQQVNEILSRGGMSLKFVAHSHDIPPEPATQDSVSMNILGYRYLSEDDALMLNLPEVNFHRKSRGAKTPNIEPCVTPTAIEKLVVSLPKLTRRHVVAKVAEMFDPLGIFEPFKAHLKRGLTALNSLDWNDEVPESERSFWIQNLKLWPTLGQLQIDRSTVPLDAVHPLRPRLICNTDASQDCGGACIYLSFKLHDGTWSSRLLTAKSRLMSFSVPRNELDAILLGTELCFAVIVSLKLPFESITIASDSLVAVSWAMNDRTRNKTFVFNRVLAINRYLRWMKESLPFACSVELVHVSGTDNVADLLTKGLVNPCDLSASSPWQSGLPWMKLEIAEMPLTRYSDISLTKDEVARFLEETISTDLIFPSDPPENNRQPTEFCLYPMSTGQLDSVACVINPQKRLHHIPNTLCQSSYLASPDNLSSTIQTGKTQSGQDNSVILKENDEFRQAGSDSVHLIDVIYYGWERSNKILTRVIHFCIKLFHSAHTNARSDKVKSSMSVRCVYCLIMSRSESTLHDCNGNASTSENDSSADCTVPDLPDFQRESSNVTYVDSMGCLSQKTSDHDMPSLSDQVQTIQSAVKIILDDYWNTRCTLLCKVRLSTSELSHFVSDPNTGVLFYKGRLGENPKITVLDLDLLNLDFFDGKEITFCNPCILPDTSIFYAYALHVHLTLLPHGGIETTLQEICKRFHPVRPRRILNKLLASCVKCRIIQKKVLSHEMSSHKSVRFTLAPPFSFLMCDLAQNFLTKSRHSGRQSMKAPALVLCCLLSGATAIYMLEDWSVASVVQALERHACRYGVPSQIFIDAGSQLKKLSSATFSIMDLSSSVRNKFACEVIQAPPKAHSAQGRVERRIGLIRDLLEKLGQSNMLLSFLNWETLFARIANDLNNLPLARPSSTSLIRPEWSVITPNRLILGRNNRRSLTGPLIIDNTPSVVLERIQDVQEAWYKLFLKTLHLFVPRPKWYESDDVFVHDIVLFFIDDSPIKQRSMIWHYGVVVAIDGLRLTIEYTLPPSVTRKLIERSKRDVVRIAGEDELDFNTESHFKKLVS